MRQAGGASVGVLALLAGAHAPVAGQLVPSVVNTLATDPSAVPAIVDEVADSVIAEAEKRLRGSYLGVGQAYAAESRNSTGPPPLRAQRWKPFSGLNASQVSAVACIGDSFLTGLNAAEFSSFVDTTRATDDYRGGSWACGSGRVLDKKPIDTLATVLRSFNPRVLGMSGGVSPYSVPCVQPNGHILKQCGLNLARDGASLVIPHHLIGNGEAGEADAASGASAPPREGAGAGAGGAPAVNTSGAALHASNTFLAQVDQLRTLLGTPMYGGVREQWVVVTIGLGFGDLWWSPRSVDVLGSGLRLLLQELRTLPVKLYVNLMSATEHGSSLQKLQDDYMWCRTFVKAWQLKVSILGSGSFNSAEGAEAFAREFNQRILELAEEFDDGKRMVVRFRPVTSGLTFRKESMDPITCFHPRRWLAQEIALGLLQNMASSPRRHMHTLAAFTAKAETEEMATFKFRLRGQAQRVQDGLPPAAGEANGLFFY